MFSINFTTASLCFLFSHFYAVLQYPSQNCKRIAKFLITSKKLTVCTTLDATMYKSKPPNHTNLAISQSLFWRKHEAGRVLK